MALAGHNFPLSLSVFLGSLTADGVMPTVKFPKAVKLLGVKLMNGANISAHDTNRFLLQLKKGNDVLASYNNKSTAQGAVAANVSKDFSFTPQLLAADTELKFDYDEYDGLPEITRIETVADVSSSLDGCFFVLQDDEGSVAFWIDVGNTGTSAPTHGADRAVEITTVTEDMTAAQVAGVIATAINADSKFAAAVSAVEGEENHIVVTASTVGVKTDAADGAGEDGTGFTFSVDQDGEPAATVTLTDAQAVLIYYPL